MKQISPSAQADARVQDVSAILREAPLSRGAVDALHDVARQMLKSTEGEVMALALRRIFDVVPAAQRVTVVAWPPHPEQGFVPLLPEEILRREGIPTSPVSASMARQAVESAQALYFLGALSDHAALSQAPSVIANQIQSAVYVPLLDEADAPIGLLCVDTPRPSAPILPPDFHFIRAVGALLAAALAADRIRQEAHRREMAAREEEVRRRAMANCLRIASHDLKNPLFAVQLAAHALSRGPKPEMRDVIVEEIQHAVVRAQRLIGTYLDASEMLDGRPLEAELADVDVHALLAEEIEFLRSVHRERPPQVENAVEPGTLRADPDKLRQVFANLLSNACKYSPPEAPIRVDSEGSGGWVTFRVSDRGVGIAPQDQASLFQPFQRVGDTSSTEGTGLGLWITRALVEAQGGRISVESTPGVGSTFCVRLPLRY